MEHINVKVKVDRTEVDEAFDRIEELLDKIKELKTQLNDLSSQIKKIKLDVSVEV